MSRGIDDIARNRSEVRRCQLAREKAEFLLRRRLAERDEDYAAKHAPHVTVTWTRGGRRIESRGMCCGSVR